MAFEGEAWDAGTGLSFEYALCQSLPAPDQCKTRTQPGSSQHRRQKSNLNNNYSSTTITFPDESMFDPHLAFFSHDLSFAPVGGICEDKPENNDLTTNTSPDIEALLDEMCNGPANIGSSSVSPIPLPSAETITTSSTRSSPSLSVSKPASSPKTSPPGPARVTKEFHFVANSDKAAAARVRNTMASRKHRQSKVNRIAELERLLAEAEEERDMWKQRALSTGDGT